MKKTAMILLIVLIFFLGTGLAQEAEEKPLPQKGPEITVRSGEFGIHPFLIHIESYFDKNQSDQEIEDLKSRGFNAFKGSSPGTEKSGMPLGKTVYLYTVHVSSHKSAGQAKKEIDRLSAKGHTAFAYEVHIQGKGDWVRVFVGYHKTGEEAAEAASILRQRGFSYAKGVLSPEPIELEFSDILIGFFGSEEEAMQDILELKNHGYMNSTIRKMPYAVQVGISDSERVLKSLEENLKSKGFQPYMFRDRLDKRRTRVLLGAFRVAKDAALLVEALKIKGFEAKPVIR